MYAGDSEGPYHTSINIVVSLKSNTGLIWQLARPLPLNTGTPGRLADNIWVSVVKGASLLHNHMDLSHTEDHTINP